MSTIKSSSANLTLNADGSGNDIKFQSNAVEKASISDAGLFSTTTVTATGVVTGDTVADANTSNVRSGRKNLIINGAMKVAQRETSSTGLGDADEGYVTLDRMRHTTNSASAGRFTSAQTAITDLPGFANCLHLDCTTADTSIAASEVLVLEHYIEGQDLQQFKKGTASAEDITVSFYMKTNKAFTFMCVLNDFDNNRVNPQQFTTTTTWTRHSITFSGDTTGTWDDDTNRGVSVSIYLHAGSDHTGGTYSANTWQSRQLSNNMMAVGIGSFYDSTSNDIKITGLQMELGSTATDFEHRSYAEELALCQRYFFKSGPQNISDDAMDGIQISVSAGEDPQYTHFFSPQMANTPTITLRRYTTTNSATQGNWHGGAFGASGVNSSSNTRAFGQNSRHFYIDDTDNGATRAGYAGIGFYADAEL